MPAATAGVTHRGYPCFPTPLCYVLKRLQYLVLEIRPAMFVPLQNSVHTSNKPGTAGLPGIVRSVQPATSHHHEKITTCVRGVV